MIIFSSGNVYIYIYIYINHIYILASILPLLKAHGSNLVLLSSTRPQLMHYWLIDPISDYIVKCVTFIMLPALNWANHFSRGNVAKDFIGLFTIHFSTCMMTSSNGNIFRVTGPLCGQFTGPGEFPKGQWRGALMFSLRLNKRLSKQPWGWWFEPPSWSLWRPRNVYKGQHGFLLRLYKMIEW